MRKLATSINLIRTFLLLNLCLLEVIATGQVSAGFSADKVSGCGSLPGVQFTDQSNGNVTTWEWDFGNGNSSSLQNPVASYVNIGSYTITLIVSDGSFSDTISKAAYINVYQGPTADFNFSPATGCSPLPVSFTSTSTPGGTPIVDYFWDFGDGSQPGSGASINHIYSSGGVKSPSLEVTDQNGCRATISKNSAINVTAAPVAEFSSTNSPVSCSVPHTVNFSEFTQGSNLTYKWDFGDGATSIAPNPSHTYTSLGQYDVSLIVSDPNCSDTILKPKYVRIENTEALFTLSKKAYCIGDTLKPINNSTGADNYRWDFGDGTISNRVNPIKILNDSGYFAIKLLASVGPTCIDQTFDTVYVEELVPQFTTDTTLSCFNDPVTFEGSCNKAVSYEWYIGNGTEDSDTLTGDTTSIGQGRAGVFSDTLKVTSNNGCTATLIKPDNRKVEKANGRIAVNGKLLLVDTLRGCLPLYYDFRDSSLSNYPIVSWNWRFDDNRQSALQHPGTYDFTQRRAYNVGLIIKDSLGCESEAVVQIVGGSKRNPNFIINQDSICPSDSIVIVDNSTPASIIDSFYYSFGGYILNDRVEMGVDTPGLKLEIFEGYGNYEVKVRVSDNGCDTSYTRSDSIFLKGPVAFTEFDSDCMNKFEVNFRTEIFGADKFYWDFGDNSPIDSVNENPTHTYPLLRTYRTTLTLVNDTNGCDTNVYEFIIPLAQYPPLVIRPDTMEYCLGEKINFFNPDSSFYANTEWFINNELISDEHILKLDFDSAGLFPFEMRVTDLFGCDYSKFDTIFVSNPQAKIGSSFINSCPPLVVDFIDASTSDTTIDKWFWNFGNGETSTQSRDTITYPVSGESDVFLKIETIFGCKDSIVEIDFLNSEVLDVSFLQGDISICMGDSVTFRNTSSGLNPVYEWDFGDGQALTTNEEYVNHTYNQAGMFTVTLRAEDENGCIIISEKIDLVKVDSIPVAAFSADTLFAPCPPLQVNFTDQSKGGVSSWMWSLSNDSSISTVQDPFRNYTEPGIYDISLVVETPNGCRDSVNKENYIQVDGPRASISIQPELACINQPIAFSVLSSTAGTDSFWDFGDGFSSDSSFSLHAYDTTGVVYPSLIVSDSSGCSVAVTDTVTIYDVFAKFSINQDTACQPFSASFSNLSEGANSYKWFFGDGTTDSIFAPQHIYPNPGVYLTQLVVNSSLGCKDTTTQTLIVDPKTIAQLQNDTGICLGDTILLTADGGINYTWSPSDILSDSTGNSIRAFPDSTTEVILIANNIYNCPDTTSMNISVQFPPNPINLTDTSIIIGESINYTAEVGNGFQYQWTPSEGVECPSCLSTNFSPLNTTLYTLSVFDQFGCFNVDYSFLLQVLEQYSLDVPSTFSPNGDGVNDVIYPKGWGLKKLISFKIYNRFGELLFESSDFDRGWDGTYKGKPQNIETYVYTVEAMTFGDKILRKKGNINLIR